MEDTGSMRLPKTREQTDELLVQIALLRECLQQLLLGSIVLGLVFGGRGIVRHGGDRCCRERGENRAQSTERASVGRGRRHPSSRALAAGYICLHVTDLRRVSAIRELRLDPLAMGAFCFRISPYLIVLRQTKVCLTSSIQVVE